MDYYLLANLIALGCALVGFVWGGILFLRPKKAMYAQMITMALGCIMFGRLFNVIRLLTEGNLTDTFQLGFLGMVGSLMFFFSSNYGTMDGLIDDKSKTFRKYRLVAMLAPLAALGTYLALFPFNEEISLLWKIEGGVLTFFVMLASYYHLKHLIFPDVDFGIVKFLRPYNALALLYVASLMAECVAMSRDDATMTLIVAIVSGVIVLLMMPFVVKGVKKW